VTDARPEGAPPGRPGARIHTGDFAIPSLDGLRAVAVGFVVAAHLGLAGVVPGGFGVTIFFFLSGFLITTLLRMEFERTGRISLRRFYLRRALRLLPPFYLVLGLDCLLTLTGVIAGQTLHLDAVIPQVLYMSNYQVVHSGWWVGRAPGTPIFWSLAVEEHFYLVFPLLYLLLRRHLPSPRQQLAVLLGLCAAVLAWRCLLVLDLHVGKDRTYVATDTRMDSLLFGCMLAIYGNPVLDRDAGTDRHWWTTWLPLGLITLLLTFVIRGQQFQETWRYSLQGIALVPLFVVAMRWHDRGIFRLLNLRWVRFLGVLSYSIYLVHLTVFYGMNDPRLHLRSPLLQAAVTLVLTLAIAVAIHHLVERPCARLRRRLSGIAIRPQVAASSAAPRPLLDGGPDVVTPGVGVVQENTDLLRGADHVALLLAAPRSPHPPGDRGGNQDQQEPAGAEQVSR
jgi:peptidoglycan/LPS O-acetylase OafA/YrhL